MFITKGTDFRHMSHGSPQTTFIYGKSAPVWVAVPIMKVCSYSYGGDCVTIEQYVFALFAECDGKDTKFPQIIAGKRQKSLNLARKWLGGDTSSVDFSYIRSW